MLIKVKITKVVEEKEIEVNFPVYRQQDVGGDTGFCVIYSKLFGNGVLLSITESGSHTGADRYDIELEHVDIKKLIPEEDIDYIFGLNKYACDEKEFRTAFHRASLFLAEQANRQE